MSLENCIEGHLLCLILDQQNLFIEFEVLSVKGEQSKWIGFNSAGTPVTVEFRGMHFDARLNTANNQATLGEIESAARLAYGFLLEGDFGVIFVTADTIEQVASKERI